MLLPVWLLCLAAPSPSLAGGFEIADHGARALGRGGAFTASAADLAAMRYNPAALSRLRGTRFMFHQNLMFQSESFQRAPLGDAWGSGLAGTTFDSSSDSETFFPLLIMAAISTDFGLDDWTFAIGVWGPHAVGKRNFKDYGPQSFMLTEQNTLLAYYSASVAWRIREDFGVGITLQYVDLAKMEYELLVDATSTTVVSPVADPASTQLLTKLNMKDRFAFSMLVGAWWKPIPALEIALSGRVIPIRLDASGDVTVDKPELVTDDLSAGMRFSLPLVLRGGVRYIHLVDGTPCFDLELDVVWEGWSIIDAYNLKFEGEINGQQVQDLVIPKAWRDTVSIRLGGDYHLLPKLLTVRAGGFWESGAAPTNYSSIDFPSFSRVGLGGGFTFSLGGVAITAGYMHVFQEDREVSERFGKQLQQRPLRPCPGECGGLTGVVANAGKFQSSYDIVSVGLDLNLSELF